MAMYKGKKDADGRCLFNRIDNITKNGLYIGGAIKNSEVRKDFPWINWGAWDALPAELRNAEFLQAIRASFNKNFLEVPRANRNEVRLVMSLFHQLLSDGQDVEPEECAAIPSMFEDLKIGSVLSLDEIISKKDELAALMQNYKARSNAKA